MESLPADVAASIVRGLGVYLRSVPVAELPKELRRFRSFRPATLVRHRDRLLEAIENEALRAEVLDWLDDARPKLSKFDASNLRLALGRPPDWGEQLAARSREGDRDSVEGADAAPDVESRIARERDRAKHARDELKSARREARVSLEKAEERAQGLRAEVERLSAEVAAAGAAERAAERDARAARDELERERRKARREVERATASLDKAREEAKGARKAATSAMRQTAKLQARVEALEIAASVRAQRSPAREPTARRNKRRRSLTAPKGLPGDDAQTLDEWLAGSRVRLLVDGYNVTKAEGGFGDLKLESQRERLVQEVRTLALRRSVPVIVVFDGSDMPPGTARRMRGPVAVEYSRPDETADDHMIALLEELPPDPVVVATNDKELQARAAALGATIASSDQLLRLIR